MGIVGVRLPALYSAEFTVCSMAILQSVLVAVGFAGWLIACNGCALGDVSAVFLQFHLRRLGTEVLSAVGLVIDGGCVERRFVAAGGAHGFPRLHH